MDKEGRSLPLIVNMSKHLLCLLPFFLSLLWRIRLRSVFPLAQLTPLCQISVCACGGELELFLIIGAAAPRSRTEVVELMEE